MHRQSFILYRNLLWLWDIISLNLVFLFAIFDISRAGAIEKREYHVLILVFNMSWMVSVYLLGLYFSKNWLDFKSFMKGTLKSYLLTALLVFSFIFLYHYDYSRVFVTTCFAGFLIALSFNRILFNLLIFSIRDRSKLAKRVVILGNNNQAQRLIRYFENEAKLVKIAGHFKDEMQQDDPWDLKPIVRLEDCMPFVVENRVNEIYSTLTPEKYPYLYELAKEAEKSFVHFKFVPDYQVFINKNVFVDFVDDMPVLSLRKEPLENTGNRIMKRAFDVVVSLFVTVFILSWLIPLLALLIKLDSRGPVFFIQSRSGKSNETFPCIKLRSLKVNKEADSKQVTRGDNRITRIGRLLRKTNLDEMPQFINVLLGHMSIVGPRPHMLKHTEDFTGLYSEYTIRHFVKPGLTGWAQVNHLRGEITKPELLRRRIEHDIWYLENWSMWLDVKIMLLTVWITITGDKNAF